MAFSPVDPSSLQGEALSRWYLRSPDEIEQERQAAQAQKYDAFFTGTDPADSPTTLPTRAYQGSSATAGDGLNWVANGVNRWRGQGQSANGPVAGPQSRQLQLAATAQPAGASGNANCPTGHVPAPPILPSVAQQPPTGMPIAADPMACSASHDWRLREVVVLESLALFRGDQLLQAGNETERLRLAYIEDLTCASAENPKSVTEKGSAPSSIHIWIRRQIEPRQKIAPCKVSAGRNKFA